MAYTVEKSKLTLWLDKETINFGKRFAKDQRKSLSILFREYLEGLRRTDKKKIMITGTVRRMTGVIKGAKVNEKDYYKYLEKKHLK